MTKSQRVELFIPGDPVGKGRPRFSRIGGKPIAYTPIKTREYEAEVALRARQSMAGQQALIGPVSIAIEAVFPIPESWPMKRKQAGELPAKKPDLDNIIKIIGDALNGIVYVDDAQICRAVVEKRYGDEPGVFVVVAPLEKGE